MKIKKVEDPINLNDFYLNVKMNLPDIIGLMCIPPQKNVENYFNKMQSLNKSLNLKELSMGMSSDYLTAVNYGSSFLRIGSKIFGERS